MGRTRRQVLLRSTAALLLVGGSVLAGIGAAQQGSGYHLLKKVALGGEGRWDYVTFDPDSHRVYIPRSTHVMVVDADGKQVGDIPKTQGVHGVAIASEFNRGFTSNGGANTVTIFDLKTLETISEVKVTGQNPDAILYDRASKRVFTFNGRTANATAIDAKTGAVAGTVALTGKPEAGQPDGAGRIYVNIEDKSQIMEFDSKELKVLNTWSLAPCEDPSGLAFDVAHKRLFAGCSNKMIAVVDATNGKVVAKVPIGAGVDANEFDPATGFVFASCGDGTLTVAHEDSPDQYRVVENVATQNGARTMALDPKTHNVYLVTADFGPPPAPAPDRPAPAPNSADARRSSARREVIPNSFSLLVFGR